MNVWIEFGWVPLPLISQGLTMLGYKGCSFKLVGLHIALLTWREEKDYRRQKIFILTWTQFQLHPRSEKKTKNRCHKSTEKDQNN